MEDVQAVLAWTKEHWPLLALAAAIQIFLLWIAGKLVVGKCESRLARIAGALERRARD